jgi:hypothetical protein
MKSKFDPRRFLEFSKELLQKGISKDNEAKYRTIYRLGADYYLDTPALITIRGRAGVDIAKKTIKCNAEEARECIARAERFFKGIGA